MRRILLQLACALVLAGAAAPGTAWADPAVDQYIVATTHYSQSRWGLAVDEFRRFLNDFPKHPRAGAARFFLAEALVQDRQFAAARETFEAFLKVEPQSPYARQARFRAGQASYLAGDLEHARQTLLDFRMQFESDSLNAYVLPYLGSIAFESKDYTAAREYFETSLSQFPAGRMAVESRLGLGRACAALDQSAMAEQQFEIVALDDGPFADDAQYHLGVLLLERESHMQAVAALAAFDDRFAESEWQSQARLVRAQSFLALKEYAAARQILEKICDQPEPAAEALYRLGLAYEGVSDWESATDAYRRAATAPNAESLLTDIYRRAGESLLRSNEPVSALLAFESARKCANGEPTAEIILGAERAALAAEAHGEVEFQASEFASRFADSELFGDHRRVLAQSRAIRKKFEEALSLYTAELAADGVGLTDEDRCLIGAAMQALDQNSECEAILRTVAADEGSRCFARASLMCGAAKCRLGNHASAAPDFQRVIDGPATEVEKVNAIAQLAGARAAMNEFVEVRRLCAELKERGSQSVWRQTIEFAAEVAVKNSRFDAAEDLFCLLATEANTETAARGTAGVAWSQFRAGRLSEAAKSFATVSEKFPSHALAAEALLLHGRIMEQTGESPAALADYRAVTDKFASSPQAPMARLASARLRHRSRALAESAQEYEELIRDFPSFSQRDAALYEVAWLRRELSSHTESHTAFETIYREYKQSAYWADAAYRLASAAHDAKDFPRAKHLLAELLESKQPGAVAPYVEILKTQIAIIEGKFDEALATVESFESRYPRHALAPTARFWQAEANYQRGEIEDAGKQFAALWGELAESSSMSPAIRLRQAQVAATLKQWNEAHEFANDVRSRWPGSDRDFEVDYLLGRVAASRAELSEAREAYLRVLASPKAAKSETAAMAQWMIGETYFHQKNYSAAIREYLRVEILHPYPRWQSAALLEAGKCEQELGDHRAAQALFVRLLKDFPQSAVAMEAAERLKMAELQAQRATKRIK